MKSCNIDKVQLKASHHPFGLIAGVTVIYETEYELVVGWLPLTS